MPKSDDHCTNCTDRYYKNKGHKLRCKLGKKQRTSCKKLPSCNSEELKYKDYNYNGQFHKSLKHDPTTGKLINPKDYENMKKGILENDQKLLASVPQASGSTIKLVNPLVSLSTPLVGAPFCALKIDTPPAFDSAAGAAEMVEVYSLAYLRDVPFTEYDKSTITDTKLKLILNSDHMNKSNILSNLKYYTPKNTPFTAKTLFRGTSKYEQVGPYVSQLLLLDVPMGSGTFIQKYPTLKSRESTASGKRCEWGITSEETIKIQNGNLSTLPQPDFVSDTRYIFDGRSLAEVVHKDAVFQLFYQAGLVLLGLGIKPNAGFPTYPNQTGFLTGFGGPALLCAISEVAGLALQHAFYWKWQVFRKLRPEVFGLSVHNVKTGAVSNSGNYNISNVVLNNKILNDIEGLYSGTAYTLPLCYIEGSPAHPSYPAGHAVIAGACCTILKMFTDSCNDWSCLPGVTSGKLSSDIKGPVVAKEDGTALIAYTSSDASKMTINGEIDKLASNVAIGRNWAGVHYRSDGVQGMALGEQIAIKYVEDRLSACVDNNLDGTVPKLKFKKFDGTTATVTPTVCK